MCGIGGILFSADGEDVLKRKISILNSRQQHRGPDGQSTLVMAQHGLCHQRLALLDATGGRQPFADPTGRYYIVYNGELYNYKELKEALAGTYDFTTGCDTEVVLAAYLFWKECCLDRFNGMFSFLIWDTLTETGFAARDPLGVKPFVYYYQSPTLYFASEIKALLPVLDTHPELDEYALSEYLIAPYLSGAGAVSLLKGIRYLEPGNYMCVSRYNCTVHRYYSFNWGKSNLPENELTALIADSIEQSVRVSLRADVPLGIFLSGGLDSSLIAAIAAQYAGYKPKAYTISFEDHDHIDFDPSTIVNSDDLPFARELAKILGLPFHETPAIHSSLAESLQQLARINDRIPVWEQEFSQHFLAKAASTDVKAVLVGDAADETNYGYYFLLNEKVNASPLGLINRFGGELRQLLLRPDRRRRLNPMQYLDDRYRKLAADAGYCFGKEQNENILAMSTLVCRRWLERLLHNGDIHTMQFGLEARVPFANRNMLAASCQVFPSAGFKQNIEKHILREAAKKWLPASFANRKKSSLPRDPRLAKTYQSILYSLLQQENEFISCYLDKAILSNLCVQGSTNENERMILFNIICLIYWAQQYAK
jgi:asparagine synthase (glutamine-hydrolysing)